MMKSCFRYMLVIFSFAALGCEAREDGRETPAVKDSENVLSLPETMERGEGKSAEDVVREILRKSDLEVGYNHERKAIIAIGTHGFDKDHKINGETPDEMRFNASKVAYLKAVGEVATIMHQNVSAKEMTGSSSEQKTLDLSASSDLPLPGVKILTQAESFLRDRGYEVAVAVAWSEKTKQAALAAVTGDWLGMPTFAHAKESTVEEFLKKNSSKYLLGPRILQTGPKDFYILGISAYRWGETDGLLKARQYALSAAMCALGGDVANYSAISKCSRTRGQDKDVTADESAASYECKADLFGFKERSVFRDSTSEDTIEKTVSMRPLVTIRPHEKGIRWYETDGFSLLTGDVKLVVVAINAKDIHKFGR